MVTVMMMIFLVLVMVVAAHDDVFYHVQMTFRAIISPKGV
jgi:hypothetical protein